MDASLEQIQINPETVAHTSTNDEGQSFVTISQEGNGRNDSVTVTLADLQNIVDNLKEPEKPKSKKSWLAKFKMKQKDDRTVHPPR